MAKIAYIKLENSDLLDVYFDAVCNDHPVGFYHRSIKGKTKEDLNAPDPEVNYKYAVITIYELSNHRMGLQVFFQSCSPSITHEASKPTKISKRYYMDISYAAAQSHLS